MVYIFLLLSLLLAGSVWKRLREIYAQFQCPDEEVLSDYYNGLLKRRKPKLYNRVVTHLGVCEKCRDRLRELEEPDIGEHLINEEEL